MNKPNGLLPLLRRLSFASVGAMMLAAMPARAQTAPSNVDPATLAKYDTNHNGVLDPNEIAAMNADQRAAAAAVQPAATASTGESGGEVVTLSPFEVQASAKGYYTPNTMSGTRFNSKLEDLAAPITVVTKEQMSDFAMLDINDIFAYTPNTEGTENFSDVVVDRNGSVSDNVQLNPTGANRIRGLGAANISFNNFEMSGRMPVDPTIVEDIEISRGPNANVFGLGNASGTVNQVGSMANLTRNFDQTKLRADSDSGYRGSVDFNRMIVPDRLALRFNAAYQHDGFVRKPSGVNTQRYNAMVKFRPFKTTTITAGFYGYHSHGTRPNFVNPRDSVSYWIQSGKPTWDPIDEVIHVNGQTLGPFTTNKNLPNYFSSNFTGIGQNYLYIDQKGIGYWTAPTSFGLSKGTLTPLQGAQTIRLMSPSSAADAVLGKDTSQPLFTTTPSVTDKSIYDWTKVNMAAINHDSDSDNISTVQLDQVFLNTPMQTLAAQFAFLREDSHRYRRDYFGIGNDLGQSGQLLVDVNEKLPDGSPNPYLGRLYFGQDMPRTYYNPLRWDNYRAQLAYKLDLTQTKGWLRWLGLHQFSGYDEYKYRVQRYYSYREGILDNHTWLAGVQSRGDHGNVSGGGPTATPGIALSYLRYYVGDPNTDSVNYAPSDFQYGSYTFNWGSWGLGKRTVNGVNTTLATPGSYLSESESAQLGLAAAADATGAGRNTKTILKTMGGVVQSHFFDDRLVTTFGVRKDKQYVKTGSSPAQLIYPQGIAFNYDSIDHWAPGDYSFNQGRTTQGGAVLKPFKDLSFIHNMDNGSGFQHFLAGALNGLFLTYNKSNSFLPQPPKISLFLQPLPNTTSSGKDYGFGLNLFDDRLVVRYDHYKVLVNNDRNGDASTIAQRVTRIDLTSNKPFLLFTQMYSPDVTPSAQSGSTDIGWVRMAHPGFTEQQVEDEVAKEMGLPWSTITALQDAFNAGTLASTQDSLGEGDEIEVYYNSPSRNWSVVANATSTKAINSNVSGDIQQWIAQRMPIWTSIKDPRDGALWWTKSYGGSQTAAQNYQSFVDVPFSVIEQQQGKAVPQIRKYHWSVSTKYRLAGITDNRILRGVTVGGAVRWEDKGGIGYYGIPDANGIYQSLDASRPIYDKSHTFLDAFVAYRMKLWGDRVDANFQINVKNLQESGRLEPIAAYPNGVPNTYRIIDPRQFIFTAAFNF